MPWLIDGLVIVSCLSVLGSHLARQHWFFDAVAQFLLPSIWMLVAAPVLLVAFLLWPRISLTHGGFVPLALAGLIAGAPILQDPVIPVPDDAVKLKVYQHNIYVENIVFDRVVNTVEREDPDIIALVEARDDTLAPWEARLQERWPYMAKAHTRRYSWARLRLFSKYPITDYQVRKRDYEPATLHAQVETPNGEITVIVAHFTRPWPFMEPEAQMRHYRALEKKLDEVGGPLVVLGDFNSTPWGRIGRRMQDDLGFELVNKRWAGTWPGRVNIDDMMDTPGLARFLTIPIDLAFCRGGLVCNNHRVGENLGSDHRFTQFDIWVPELDALSADERQGDDGGSLLAPCRGACQTPPKRPRVN